MSPKSNAPDHAAAPPHAERLPIRTRPAAGENRHGGAWKVAYADFVTALMALFIVLWMMNASDKVKQSVSGYFRDPRGYSERHGAGPGGSGEGLPISRSNIAGVRAQIEAALRRAPELGRIRNNVKLSVTGEGLRIDLLESEQGMFFVSGSADPTETGKQLLMLLAREIATMQNGIVIEGHTDALPFRNAKPAAGYGNWDLSTDRANAARRLLHAYGVRTEQVVEVRGFADRKLMNAGDPSDPHNRRVSLVVQFPAE